MLELYQFAPSGNCYKVRLLLKQLGIPFRTVEVDLTDQEGAKGVLERLPFGRVPAVILENGKTLAESNAILLYFAEGTALLPADKLARARVHEWLFWEQYDHEPYLAVVRAWRKYFGVPKGRENELALRIAKGEQALGFMDAHLAAHPFLAGQSYTVADIALFAYTHVAEDGGFRLSAYPSVQAWMARVRSQPGFVAIDDA